MGTAPTRRVALALVILASAVVAIWTWAPIQTGQTVTIRGHDQWLRVYGTRGGTPIIVSSGDGGWIHLAPHVAGLLAAKGYFVVGFDARAYLESFTNGTTTLRVEDEPGDYRALVDFATRGTRRKAVLMGISEGAGLSVLAATDPDMKETVAGVIGLGLSDLTELGWRWRDMVIYFTHGTPNEPTFSTAGLVYRMSPVPLAIIHSTHDEFVPIAEAKRVFGRAEQPKRFWTVKASNHRFSDNLQELDRCLLEAIGWISGVNSGGAAK